MKEFDLALQILSDDLDNDVPFPEALRKVFLASAEDRPYRAEVSGLLGCELRHHQLFTYLLSPYEDFSVADKRAVMLTLANDYFFRHIPRETFDAALKEKIGEEKFERVLPLLDKAANPETYIPEHIDRQSNLYLSLRYNAPEWFLKILQREGHGACYRIIRQFTRPFPATVRVTRRMDPEKLGENFVETEVKGIYTYKGKEPLRRNEDYQKNRIFDERPYVKLIYDKMNLSEASNVLLYAGQEGNEWEQEMLESMSTHSNVNIASQDISNKSALMRLIKEGNHSNVNLFEAPNPDEMAAAITNLCDLVIVAPRCSQFDRIPALPDSLLHFNREVMDGVYAMQGAALAGCAKHVEEGGRLVYCLPTISRREGHRTLEAFLREHPEFSLDEEKQLYPFEPLGVAFFYAVLYKGEKAAVADNLPFVEAPVASQPSVASASEAE